MPFWQSILIQLFSLDESGEQTEKSELRAIEYKRVVTNLVIVNRGETKTRVITSRMHPKRHRTS